MSSGEIGRRLDDLREEIQKDAFLWGKGLSNEVNIQIFCYAPEDEMEVRHFVRQLSIDQALRCRLVERNLYQIFLQICDDNHITGRIPRMEERKGGDNLLLQLSGVVTKEEFIARCDFPDRTVGRDILLITGVGEAFPFIRVHTLLEALQPAFPDIPILVLYPGKFEGHELKLFNLLSPNPYYRAFNIAQF